MKGLAWAVRVTAPGTQSVTVIAVLGPTVVLRGIDGRWRVGHYMDGEAASDYALRMTESYETTMGGDLVAGPAEFDSESPDAPIVEVSLDILRALDLPPEDPSLTSSLT